MKLLDCYDIGDLYYDKDMSISNDGFWIVLDKAEQKTIEGIKHYIRMARISDGVTHDYTEEMVHKWFKRVY